MKIAKIVFLLVFILFLPVNISFAQSYYFYLENLDVHVFIEEDGTYSIDYLFDFTNIPGSSPIDYVDVGLPNSNFQENNITAQVNGKDIGFISKADYQGSGTGVALGLSPDQINPGENGKVRVFISGIRNVIYPDSQDDNYASAVFHPTWFDSRFIQGNTNLSVTFHLPPGVTPEEPRWHSAPKGFPGEPETGIDSEGRITYTWVNPDASGSQEYEFGASFPAKYIPENSIVRQSSLGGLFAGIIGLLPNVFCCGVFALGIAGIFASLRRTQQRKLQYLPPKISIEGHGIKRGLTAVEASILLEQPLDKILTMILFSTIKKNAANVVERDPLKINVNDPLPEELQPYEVDFLKAMQDEDDKSRRLALQAVMIDLVNSVSKKMKGFSRKETIDYYQDIIKRAWLQVESAGTPEIKSQKFDENMDWTMLDENYEDRTKDVFQGGPVYVPMWWPRYDPNFGRPTPSSSHPAPVPSTSGQPMTIPHLPGSDFAASMVTSVQDFSSSVIGNVGDFTKSITEKTNPLPVTTSTRSIGRSGGCACACACACAGCACACAGGGR